MSDLKQQCEGRWMDILDAIGIGSIFLNGKNGPCPLCGGSDRFRYTNYKDQGGWFCSQCGNGSGFDIIMRFKNVDFKRACEVVEEILNINHPKRRPSQKVDYETRKKFLKHVGYKSILLTGVCRASQYLKNRGLSLWDLPLNVYFCPNLETKFYIGCEDFRAAIIYVIKNSVGKTISFQAVFLNNDCNKDTTLPEPKKTCPPIEPLKNCAVQLSHKRDPMGIAEGVETALACKQMYNISTWALLGTGGFKSFDPPTKNLFIYADNDLNFSGQICAYQMAARLHQKDIRCVVCIPRQKGGDYMDDLHSFQGLKST